MPGLCDLIMESLDDGDRVEFMTMLKNEDTLLGVDRQDRAAQVSPRDSQGCQASANLLNQETLIPDAPADCSLLVHLCPVVYLQLQ
jgi:hypothetical protein